MLGGRGAHSATLQGSTRRFPSSSPRPFGHSAPRSRVLLSSAGKDTGAAKEKGPDGSDGPGKADFSAYWSLRIKQALDNRRKYLEDIDRKGIPESELVKKVEQRAMEYAQQLNAMDEEQRELIRLKLEAQRQLQESAGKDAAAGSPFEGIISPQQAALVTEADIKAARAELRAATVYGPSMNLHRAGQVVRAVLLSPFNLALALQQWWSSLYNSQRYENFLMAEGERIWYWRNRTENERWFWEIIVWERLLLPLLCTVAYQSLVPSHWFWVLVVPLTFIYMQSGELPSWRGIEFWFIAYFGFYLKLWPQCAAALKTMALTWGL